MRQSISVLITVATLTLPFVGCSAPELKPGQKDYSEITGRLTAVEAASLDRVFHATQAAMKTLELRHYDQDKDGLNAQVVGTDAEGQNVVVNLLRLSDTTTQITMHIEVLVRNERLLEQLLVEMRKEIKNRE